MYDSSTMDAVRDAAQALTRDAKLLTIPNPEFPLAIFADGYTVDEQPNQVGMSDELAASVEDHFDEVNQDVAPVAEGEQEDIVSNFQAGIAQIQYNTSNVIIPAIKAMHTDYASRQNTSSQADTRVEPFYYDEVHNDPRLVNHVNERYTNVRPTSEYRSFLLAPASADQIIEMVAVNNPHLDQQQVTEWLLKMQPSVIEATWSEFFGKSRAINPRDITFLQLGRAPFNVDQILLAYCICGHYIDNPVAVPGESVDLDEWEHSFKLLHEMMGHYLMRAYVNRAEAVAEGVLVLRYEAQRPIENRRVVVTLNGDVSPAWLTSGGDIQAVLGAAVEGSEINTVKAINAKSAELVKRWIQLYPLIKQAALDYSNAQCRRDVQDAFLSQASQGALKDIYTPEVRVRLQDAMRYIRPEALNNPYVVFAKLVCNVFFPEGTYMAYLEAIDEYGQNFPNASLRELNTQGLLSLTAIYLAKQIVVEPFIADVDPDATLPEGEEDLDSGLLAVQGDDAEGETAEEIDMTGDNDAGISDGNVDASGGDDFNAEGDDSFDDQSGDDAFGDEGDTDLDDDEEDPYGDVDAGEEESDVDDSIDTEEETEEEEVEEEDFQ